MICPQLYQIKANNQTTQFCQRHMRLCVCWWVVQRPYNCIGEVLGVGSFFCGCIIIGESWVQAKMTVIHTHKTAILNFWIAQTINVIFYSNKVHLVSEQLWKWEVRSEKRERSSLSLCYSVLRLATNWFWGAWLLIWQRLSSDHRRDFMTSTYGVSSASVELLQFEIYLSVAFKFSLAFSSASPS